MNGPLPASISFQQVTVNRCWLGLKPGPLGLEATALLTTAHYGIFLVQFMLLQPQRALTEIPLLSKSSKNVSFAINFIQFSRDDDDDVDENKIRNSWMSKKFYYLSKVTLKNLKKRRRMHFIVAQDRVQTLSVQTSIFLVSLKKTKFEVFCLFNSDFFSIQSTKKAFNILSIRPILGPMQ